MELAWKIFRAIVLGLLLIAVAIPTAIYVALSTETVQNEIRNRAAGEVSRLLGVQVDIDHVRIHPFNQVTVSGIRLIEPTTNDTVVTISTVSAAVDLYHYLRTRQLTIDYAVIDSANLHMKRADPQSPVNVAEILSRIKSDRRSGRKSTLDLRINTVVMRKSSISYEVLSEPKRTDGRFDANHMAISDIELNAYVPSISAGRYDVEISHLSFVEQSGFTLSRLQARSTIGHQGLDVQMLAIDLPDSHFALQPLHLSYDGYADIPRALAESPAELASVGRCRLYLPDFSVFEPALHGVDRPLALEFNIHIGNRMARINNLALSDVEGGAFALRIQGEVSRTDSGFEYDLENCTAAVDGYEASLLAAPFIPASTRFTMQSIATQAISLKAKGDERHGSATILTDGSAGNINACINYNSPRTGVYAISGKVIVKELDLGLVTRNNHLGNITGIVEGSGKIGSKPSADVKAHFDNIDFNGYSYSGIDATVTMAGRNQIESRLDVNDSSAIAHVFALYTEDKDSKRIQTTATIANTDLYALGFDKKREGYRFGAKINADMDISDPSKGQGYIRINDIRWLDNDGNGIRVGNLSIDADSKSTPANINLKSDFINGHITGEYNFGAIARQFESIASQFVPALLPDRTMPSGAQANDFTFDFTINPCENISEFFGLPVHIISDAELTGAFDSNSGSINICLDAPYLRNGDKLIEHTTLFATMEQAADRAAIYATTQLPTNKGDMSLTAFIHGTDNHIDTRLDWTIDRRIPLNGTMSFGTKLHPSQNRISGGISPIPLTIAFNPGSINFGEDTWLIKESNIEISGDHIAVDGFGITSGTQSIAIDGIAGRNDDDRMAIDLQQVRLLPIFETLEIDKAMIGGRATGRFDARQLLGTEPVLRCPRLHVDSIGYNRCTIGDADIEAWWDNESKAFWLDADIKGIERGDRSRIGGRIFPMDEALDINFDAHYIPVGFLKPFMEAFASDIKGHATGQCRLFGTFKEVDLEGAVMAHDVEMKIDFTNTSYIANDSVRMTPGLIEMNNVTIRDVEGHTARLDGVVHHTYFKEPVFRFDISHAQNFLSYNTTPHQYPDWYGTIYGNGGATISGYPGVVDIKVDMSTAPGSWFTFVLSDRLDAETYSFLNFRDITPDTIAAIDIDPTEAVINDLKNRIRQSNEDQPSDYNMDLRVGITKDATMTLVMDPTAGDEIKATGEGNMRLSYQSVDNSLNIWGSYKVLAGSYRFTLQDIIIRDFTIKEGSEIRFDGDPYAVKTNLKAYYATNANLSDLDESFLQDKDINRTNVPVHALMLVTGDIRQPTIDFDLEFPTLTSDTYRKVRSIVSTTDMMNRQIIYLLALNRFYTPDYMSSTTKGSELFSVASSTISSQLGNMLGKLSENWSIAPNLRSDRGDFSDVEVDVALSSRLLNNRLLFNGNFGYRDKALNSNQFVGDFDIEYLLNKRGSWRLKAYNRYNDRNFYVRTAQTTQGVGLVFRRDFDDFLSFLRQFQKKNAQADSTSYDTDSQR